ncbi:MAG TPA: PTS sugar transporter subunit IIA, partial [Candidatus Obscuribacterales bacterium]
MVQLGVKNVCLKAVMANKTAAIRQVGALLVDGGNIAAGYVESMLRREQQANTYLGNGIAIPHGQPQDRELIHQTGIAVVQIPAGVEWNPGEVVHLVVGIAAKSDEHLQILTNLTHVLDDAAAVQRLTHTDDPTEIIERLTRGAAQADSDAGPGAAALGDFDRGLDVTITGAAGLHARPAAALVEVAKSFTAAIRVRHGAQVANGKSLM